MSNKKTKIGRPVEMNYKVMGKLEDALRNRATVSEACRYAGVSRDTYYRYLNNNDVFAQHMNGALKERLLFTSILF